MPLKVTDSNRAKVLAVLYNASKPLGMGFLHYNSAQMTEEEAQDILDSNPSYYFDYLSGRVMKVDLKGPEVDFWLYNRDNGNGAGEIATRGL